MKFFTKNLMLQNIIRRIFPSGKHTNDELFISRINSLYYNNGIEEIKFYNEIRFPVAELRFFFFFLTLRVTVEGGDEWREFS